MITLYDAVDVKNLPTNTPRATTWYAGYVNGAWPTYRQLTKLFPRHRVLSISVDPFTLAEVLDVERGDASPSQAPAWVERARLKGLRPVVYCSYANWATVKDAFVTARVPEPFYWIAHWTYQAHLDDGAIATQWSDKGPGNGVAPFCDVSLVSPNFPDAKRHRLSRIPIQITRQRSVRRA